KDWVNIGGQIVPAYRVDQLRREIGEGKYANWNEIHNVYDAWDEAYPLDKSRHAWAVLKFLRGMSDANVAGVQNNALFKQELAEVQEIRRWIDRQIYKSREKDYLNPFKKATFRNEAEMEQVLGKPGDNPFIRLVRKESAAFCEMIERVKVRLGD
ncbi:MAG: DUF4954 family protein, partial [Treponema sp.]|nr:DUF4954 family protein [Treponema sp.]